MISYHESGFQLRLLCRVRGSVLPRACAVALIVAAVSGFLKAYALLDLVASNSSTLTNPFDESETIIPLVEETAPQMFMGFSSILGFILVFRSNQSMMRLTHGLQEIYGMSARWAEACRAIIAFSNTSPLDEYDISVFQRLVVQIFSMLHSSAMQDISGDPTARFTVIHAGTLDDESLELLESTDGHQKRLRSDVVHQWITELIVEHMHTGVLKHIPPPVLTRVFQEIAQGNQGFQSALTITNVPVPLPYSQLSIAMLCIYSLVMPYFSIKMTNHWYLSALMSFLMIASMCAVHLIAVEIEQPFQDDPNDLPMHEIHDRMNECLTLLLDKRVHRVPRFTETARISMDDKPVEVAEHSRIKSFYGARLSQIPNASLRGSQITHVYSMDSQKTDAASEPFSHTQLRVSGETHDGISMENNYLPALLSQMHLPQDCEKSSLDACTIVGLEPSRDLSCASFSSTDDCGSTLSCPPHSTKATQKQVLRLESQPVTSAAPVPAFRPKVDDSPLLISLGQSY